MICNINDYVYTHISLTMNKNGVKASHMACNGPQNICTFQVKQVLAHHIGLAADHQMQVMGVTARQISLWPFANRIRVRCKSAQYSQTQDACKLKNFNCWKASTSWFYKFLAYFARVNKSYWNHCSCYWYDLLIIWCILKLSTFLIVYINKTEMSNTYNCNISLSLFVTQQEITLVSLNQGTMI